MKTTLRWIAVPFAALGALWVADIIATFVLFLDEASARAYTGMEVSGIYALIGRMIRDGVVGAAFVLAGCYTAPSYKRIVAIVLCTIISVISCIVLIILMFIGNFSILTLLGIIAAAIGSIIGARHAYEQFEENKE